MNTGTVAAFAGGAASGFVRPVALGRDTVAAQPASELQTLVADCVSTGVERRVLVVRLSRLPWSLARPRHLRLVRAALEPLASANRARAFHLDGGDFAIVWRGEAEAALTRSRRTIEHLFLDAGVADLLTELHLPRDAEALLEEACPLAPAAGARAASETVAPDLGPAARPIDPASLVLLEQGLARADLAGFMRREPVCEAVEGRLEPRWERRVPAVSHAVRAVAADIDPHADPWLFRRLTRTLDHRVLALLSSSTELRDAGPFAIGLNVASVLGPEFMRFDTLLPARLRGQVTLDLDAADVMADLAAFAFARDFARDRGYRLGLRGLEGELVAALPAGRLGFDIAYMTWPAGALAAAPPDLAALAPARIVLRNGAGAAAAEWAVANGIVLFEGAPAI